MKTIHRNEVQTCRTGNHFLYVRITLRKLNPNEAVAVLCCLEKPKRKHFTESIFQSIQMESNGAEKPVHTHQAVVQICKPVLHYTAASPLSAVPPPHDRAKDQAYLQTPQLALLLFDNACFFTTNIVLGIVLCFTGVNTAKCWIKSAEAGCLRHVTEKHSEPLQVILEKHHFLHHCGSTGAWEHTCLQHALLPFPFPHRCFAGVRGAVHLLQLPRATDERQAALAVLSTPLLTAQKTTRDAVRFQHPGNSVLYLYQKQTFTGNKCIF